MQNIGKEEIVIGLAILWALIGMYAGYLGTWNTRTHKERFELIKKWHLQLHGIAGVGQLVSLLIFGAITGPIGYAICKVDYYRWKIRTATRDEV